MSLLKWFIRGQYSQYISQYHFLQRILGLEKEEVILVFFFSNKREREPIVLYRGFQEKKNDWALEPLSWKYNFAKAIDWSQVFCATKLVFEICYIKQQ